MNLDELQSVQSRERQTDSLQQLRATFYEDAAAFVQDLREERARAAEKAEDPFDSPDVNRLSDDIRTAEQTVEAIYERRVGKVVKMASLAAADMPTEQDGLTNEEQELFETMVAAIEDHRGTILDVLGGDAPAGTVSSPPPGGSGAGDHAETSENAGDGVDAAALMGEGSPADEAAADQPTPEAEDSQTPPSAGPPDESPGSQLSSPGASGESSPDDPAELAEADDGTSTGEREPTDSPAHVSTDEEAMEAGDDTAGGSENPERVTVRITEDVGEIFGVDEREYDLAAEDVVTLPATNAEPLIDRDAAEPLE